MKVDDASQTMSYASDGEALDIISASDPWQTADPKVLMDEIAEMAADYI